MLLLSMASTIMRASCDFFRSICLSPLCFGEGIRFHYCSEPYGLFVWAHDGDLFARYSNSSVLCVKRGRKRTAFIGVVACVCGNASPAWAIDGVWSQGCEFFSFEKSEPERFAVFSFEKAGAPWGWDGFNAL